MLIRHHGVSAVYDAADPELHVQQIQAANTAASTALLHLMQNELGLASLLLSFKQYFLLDRGDVIMTFLDDAEDELARKLGSVSWRRLRRQLDEGEPETL